MIAVLLSCGCHPVSGRPRMNPGCARAAELALTAAAALAPGAELHALHVGDPANPALRDYLGLGLDRLTVLDPGGDCDALPLLARTLATLRPRLILCGDRAETGEGSGMLPYALAAQLGLPVLAGLVETDGRTALQQAAPRVLNRHALDRAAVLVAAPQAPPARPMAFARARAGRIEILPVAGTPDPLLAAVETRPARTRPRRIAGAGHPGTGHGSAGSGPALTGLDPEQAAARIADFLQQHGLIGRDSHERH